MNAPRKLNLSSVLFSSTSHFKTTMIDNLRISHLNVRAFNDQVKQNSLLKRVGYEYDILHLAETHSSPRTEAVVKKSYPHLEFYFNHGPQFKERLDGRRNDKEQVKGTLIVFPSSLGKASAFKILIQGQLSCLDLKLEAKTSESPLSTRLVRLRQTLG